MALNININVKNSELIDRNKIEATANRQVALVDKEEQKNTETRAEDARQTELEKRGQNPDGSARKRSNTKIEPISEEPLAWRTQPKWTWKFEEDVYAGIDINNPRFFLQYTANNYRKIVSESFDSEKYLLVSEIQKTRWEVPPPDPLQPLAPIKTATLRFDGAPVCGGDSEVTGGFDQKGSAYIYVKSSIGFYARLRFEGIGGKAFFPSYDYFAASLQTLIDDNSYGPEQVFAIGENKIASAGYDTLCEVDYIDFFKWTPDGPGDIVKSYQIEPTYSIFTLKCPRGFNLITLYAGTYGVFHANGYYRIDFAAANSMSRLPKFNT